MNKKIYIQPRTEVFTVELQRMIAASNPDKPTFTVTNEEVTEGYADSRRGGSFWDDEE